MQPRFGEGPLEDSRPPRAANMVGIAVLGAASIAYAAGWDGPGRRRSGCSSPRSPCSRPATGFCTGCEAYKLRLPADRAAVRLVPDPSDAGSMNWQLSLAGLLVGLLVGMTGMGGGSLMTPLLVLVFGFKPTVAIGTDILHGAIFKSFGAWRHRSLGTVHARLRSGCCSAARRLRSRASRSRRGSSTATATASRRPRRTSSAPR